MVVVECGCTTLLFTLPFLLSDLDHVTEDLGDQEVRKENAAEVRLPAATPVTAEAVVILETKKLQVRLIK